MHNFKDMLDHFATLCTKVLKPMSFVLFIVLYILFSEFSNYLRITERMRNAVDVLVQPSKFTMTT